MKQKMEQVAHKHSHAPLTEIAKLWILPLSATILVLG